MDRSEEMREALLDLEESRKRERQLRKTSEALLAGLQAIVLARDPDEIFRELSDVLREPLDFEAAFVLRENSDTTLTAIASSDPSFADTVWRPQAMFERAFAGQPVAVYDTELVDEWRSQPDPVKQGARSALHFAIHVSEPRTLFVCTHPERAHFSQQHVTLARRFSVLATQALQKIESGFEITDLKRAQERIEHLNLVLRAVRNVNQLITKEKDRDRLLQGVCEILTGDRGYANAWLALLDEKQMATTTAESGLGASFEPMAEQLGRGELPDCARAALSLGEVIVDDPVAECADCPLAPQYSGRVAVSVRLEHEGKVHGLITVSVPGEFARDEEELSLFKEVAGDIAFALHSMEIDEEREKAEEQLQKSEARLRQIIDIVPHFVFAKDRDGRFIMANRAAASGSGTTPEDMVGKTHPELLGANSEQYESYLTDDRQVIDSGKLKFIPEEDFTHADGHKVIMETTKIPFTSAGIPAVLGVSVDITARVQAEEEKAKLEQQLRQQQKLESIGTLAGGVAHEINNPINGIMNYAQL
ncbi:MAG: GAF domain-containing protein, partial [Thermoanaerobaculales bacterium]|nr:GAF domain-containing protein [Thermoanaerobaculales bacterium]